jgi:hypothetical protein
MFFYCGNSHLVLPNSSKVGIIQHNKVPPEKKAKKHFRVVRNIFPSAILCIKMSENLNRSIGDNTEFWSSSV